MSELKLQAEIFESIRTLCANYKKDSAARKTQEYLTKRLISLNNQWEDFHQRHQVLLKLEDKNMEYFNENIYEKTKELYETTKNDILKTMLAGATTSSETKMPSLLQPDAEQNLNEKTKELLQRQECNFKAIKRAMVKINLEEITNKWDAEDHLNILRSKWEAVDKLHWELETLNQTSERNYVTLFNEIEQQYDHMRKKLNAKIWSNAHFHQSAPSINIPDFTGSYSQWVTFKDLFMESLHKNPTISNAQKMQHLKSKLKGEPERLIQHLHISAENYESCWEILNQRYDNRRLLFTSYMNNLLNLPVIQQPNAFNLKKIHDIIIETLNGLANMGINTLTWDPMIVHIMSQKLDTTTYNEYTKELQDPRDIPALSEFTTFLENKFMAFETMRNQHQPKDVSNTQKYYNTNKYQPAKKPSYPFKKELSKIYYTSSIKCPLCNGMHVLMQCAKFNDMGTEQKNATVTKLQVCKNCLYSHGNERCKSTKTCKECNMPHHTLLHNNNMKKITTYHGKNNTEPRPSTSSQQTNHLSNENTEILLTTTLLKVKASNGSYITLRALLDQGSQVNLISENAAQLLNLPRKNMNASISGVGSVSGDCTGYVNLDCMSIHSNFNFRAKTLIMKKLINNLPNKTFQTSNWEHIQNLKLADPEFNVSRRVDILLGAAIYSMILMDGVLKPDLQSPTAQQTHLGWILCGSITTLNCYITLTNLDEITKFWETEDILETNNDIPSDDFCEKYYQETTTRDTKGRYAVKMPLCTNFEEKIGKSKATAAAQYLQLERRLSRNPELDRLYRDFIHEYIKLGHMKPSTSQNEIQNYLPHHGVLRESSTTTKLRVVFNASQKTSSGYSLNDLMEKGPNLQIDIQKLILKWRSYEFVFTADIEKMYRCINLDSTQRPLQKILWRDNPNDKLQEMELCTITYGMKSAPWLAIRTLKQLALDDGHKYPEAAKILLNECYVDDVISGHHSLEKAKELQSALINLLKGGKMNLRKWTSNKPELLETLNADQIASSATFDFKDEVTQKTLGLAWNPQTDTFTFDWKTNESTKQETKRKLLSEISTLYDPLGWLAPITIAAKLLFQEVWMCKIGWDEKLPEEINKKWLKLRMEVGNIQNIQINRWIGSKHQNIELHGFCDASEKAYACVVYCRIIDEGDHPIVTLLAAKTKVAPLSQTITLPKLELNGALLLSQLMEKIIDALQDNTLTIYAWCDSKVVLAWIQGNKQKWERYITNRVEKVTKIIPADKWNYVHTSINPADCASRGLSPMKLMNYKLWWQGPSFLLTFNEQNQETKNCLFTTDIGRENNNKQTYATFETEINDNFINKLLYKHSSLTYVYRVIAWVSRVITTMRRRKQPEASLHYLTSSELNTSAEHVIRFIQNMEFSEEIKKLKGDNTVPKNSKIFKLSPYLDNNGIIRVGGRLKHSELETNMKNPVILPHSGRFTSMVIDQAHALTLHGGARLTLAQIRQRFWIIGGNSAVKQHLRKCVSCYRHRSTNNHQKMSDLPKPRVTPSRPFTHTGMDFTGSIDIKINKGRGVKTSKGYIVIFVCMATKAVHIELTSDMSTETFIAAFKRMCARRGTPAHVYSDNGTNFVGAAKGLKKEFEYFKQLLTPEFFKKINELEVQWHFNAPAWPNAGGLWESAIKSMKHHLRRTIGEQKLTYEELLTILAEIEACLNSRPLCPLTEDPEEFYNTLTPGHFLTGGPILSLPQADRRDVTSIDIRKRWQLTTHMTHRFWKTWSNDYLHQLQVRSKWQTSSPSIKKNDVVLIKDENLPPGKWALGRVVELHPGPDDRVRVTTLKTKNGLIKRPVVKLSPLPVQNDDQKSLHIQFAASQKEGQTQVQNDRSIKSVKKGKMSLSTIFTTMLTLFTIIGSQVNALESSTQITSLEKRPIFYDSNGKIQLIHDEWILLMYYNLTVYWEGIRSMEIYLDHLKTGCERLKPQYCKNTVDQLFHEMNLLNYYNTMLLSPHQHLSTRRKRGVVNGVGYLANDLFGVLDERFAEKYHKDIKEVKNNEKYLLNLIKNQTSIVELQNKALKKNEANIKSQFDNINSFLKQVNVTFRKIENSMEAMMFTNYFMSTSITASLLLANLRRMQETFLDTLTDIYQGHVDIHLFTPVTLIQQLTEISGHLPRTLFLPVDNIREEIKDVYRLLYVKGRITESYFLFEIHIPLVCDEDFTLYQPIPLPISINNETANWVHISTDFIAVNLRKNTYTTLSQEDIKHCTQRRTDNYICNAKLPIYNLHNKKAPCEAKLLDQRSTSPCETRSARCRDSWVKLHTQNMWLIICCDECVIRMICDKDVTINTITTSSIVIMSQGCVLQTEELMIYSHNQFNSRIKMDTDIKIPTINSTINRVAHLAIQRMPQIYNSNYADFEELDKKIARQKNRENIDIDMTMHDIHHYTISYVLVLSALVIFIVWLVRKRRCCSFMKNSPSTDQRTEDIEMQEMRPAAAARAATTTQTQENIAFKFD